MYFLKEPVSLEHEFRTSLISGLTSHEAETRLTQEGLNQLTEARKTPLFLVFLKQFNEFLVLLLIGAAIISFAFGEILDSAAILVIVLLNGILGFIQEYKAEKTLEALKKMASTTCKVVRNNVLQKLDTRYLVTGDIIVLETGDKIPADARIIECVQLKTLESSLTGESTPVEKSTKTLSKQATPISDQTNMVFKDTIVVNGRARCLVVAKGINTEVGRVAALLSKEENPTTPLQLELKKVGQNLSLAALLIIMGIFFLQTYYNNISMRSSFLSSISLAVAAIPEGLPAVITLILALGVIRLAKQKAVIRKLPAVESLGSITHILTDKTGTLTQNKMMVSAIWDTSKSYAVEGLGYEPEGKFLVEGSHQVEPLQEDQLIQLLKASALCNDATLQKNSTWEIIGDVTEGSLIVCAAKAGIDVSNLRAQYKRLEEIPFSSDYKYMATIHMQGDKLKAYVKGSPESLAKLCIDKPQADRMLHVAEDYARQGLRSLAIGFKEIDVDIEEFRKSDPHKMIEGLSLLGVLAQNDPLRPEVKKSLAEAKLAGITTIMVTGDHKLTAFAIAKELGILTSEQEILTGEKLADLTEPELYDIILKGIKVFARVSPDQKLRLVQAYKQLGYSLAVTGDGVNDAPAIKAADIGISMGIEGTDVAREVSDMVLQDDNYATIINAIKEGRIIFDNLVKFTTFLIACNISEILVILFGVLLKTPVPLLPIQILWVNLITDGLPAIALGVEPGDIDVMRRAPRTRGQGILTGSRWFMMGIEGLIIGLACFGAFWVTLHTYSLEAARTVAFLTVALSQITHAFNKKSENRSLIQTRILNNPVLLATALFTVLIQISTVATETGRAIFKSVLPTAPMLFPILIACLTVIAASEIIKLGRRWYH